MKPNIDIDRISLEDRLSLLENNPPSGGGGGSISSGALISAETIQNATVNDVTRVDGGWLFKAEILNSSNTLGSTLNNLRVHIALFFPETDGFLLHATQAFFSIKCLRQSQLTGPEGTLNSFQSAWISSSPDFFSPLFDGVYPSYTIFSAPNINLYLLNQGDTSQKQGFYLLKTSLHVGVRPPNQLELVFRIATPWSQHPQKIVTIFPSTAVGFAVFPLQQINIDTQTVPPFRVGGNPTSIFGYSIKPGETFPVRFVSILPKSWTN